MTVPGVPSQPTPISPLAAPGNAAAHTAARSGVGGAGGTSDARGEGLAMLGAAAAVFVVCCIIQSACGASMFSTDYADSGNVLKGLLINVTFFPGWAATAVLAIKGFQRFSSGS